jgi:hypothetical protein
VREIRSPGSVRGVPGNRHSYRDTLDLLLRSKTCPMSPCWLDDGMFIKKFRVILISRQLLRS